jgi:hypothetical protein
MLYYYNDYSYEYGDNGNHGNGDNEYEYESYSDYPELDHCEPDHTLSEPDYHDHDTDQTEYNNYANCENNANDANREVDEAHPPQWSEYKGNEVYEHGELEYEGHEVHEHGELVYDDDEALELRELENMVDKWGYEPQGLEHHNSGALGTHGDKYGRDDDDDDVHTSTPTYVPTSPLSFTPAPTPLTRDSSNSNQ